MKNGQSKYANAGTSYAYVINTALCMDGQMYMSDVKSEIAIKITLCIPTNQTVVSDHNQ